MKQGSMKLTLGRASPSPPAGKNGYPGLTSGQTSLTSGTQGQGNRFNNGLMGPPPGIGVQLDANIERDAYGQPLSPTHLFINNNSFNQMGSDVGMKKQSSPQKSSEKSKDLKNDALQEKKSTPRVLGENKGSHSSILGNSQFSTNIAKRAHQIEGNLAGMKKDMDEALQSSLKGTPKMAGLSIYEYQLDQGLRFSCEQPKAEIIHEATVQRYHQTFYRNQQEEKKKQTLGGINRKNIQIETDKHIFSLNDDLVQVPSQLTRKNNEKNQGTQRETPHLMEVQINLPVQTMLEQLELKCHQKDERYELAQKYIKLSGVTRSSLVQKDSIERDQTIGPDVQMTILGDSIGSTIEEEQERYKAQKYYKLHSGYFDKQKKLFEMNYSGAVCNQVNLQFEFDRQKALELIQKCKDIQQKKMSQMGIDFNTAQVISPVSQNSRTENAGGARKGLENTKIGHTKTQSLISSNGDMYDIEGSELASQQDDCDYEVQNLQRKLQKQRTNYQNNNGEQNSQGDLVKTEDIKIVIDDQQEENQSAGGDIIAQSPTKNVQAHADGTRVLDKNQKQIVIEYSAEEKLLFEERKLFEGNKESIWAARLLQYVFSSVKVVGFSMNKIPAITNLSHLMNISFYLRQERVHLEDALEVDFLLGTLLISSKRNTQAIELLRNRVQKPYLKQIEANYSRLSGKEDANVLRKGKSMSTYSCLNQLSGSILSFDDKQNLKIQIKKLFTRCAIIELMCSESMCIRPQLNDKLQSLVRMTQLCRGQIVQPMSFCKQLFLADDEYTTMIKILPFMLKFTIQCIEYNPTFNREIVIVSALRNIQFILETQGCSLDSAMIVILKQIFKNYPDKVRQEKILRRARDFKEKILQKRVDLLKADAVPQKTLLSDARRYGNIQGTLSANELNLRSQKNKGFDSSKDIDGIMDYQFNQNSARGSGTTDQMRLDEAQNLRDEFNKFNKSERKTIIESIYSLSWVPYRDDPKTAPKEPNSGFEKTLMNLFNNLLETYISVLSSISSHILHQIFYEVVVPCLVNQPFEEDKVLFEQMDQEEQMIHQEYSAEVKTYAVKIAEKIITICQGDLVMSSSLLDNLVKAQSALSHKQRLEASNATELLRSQMKNLWASIRTKVFTNYSMKGFKQLIEWLVKKMSQLAQNCTILDGKSSASEIAMLELPEDDVVQLMQYLEIITFISVGRRNSQEEANSLIKIKQDYCMDLYLLLNPLLFWLDFSVEREERLSLFKQVYQTIKDVLENLPPRKIDIDILQIIIPILQRTSEYLRQNSPTQSMLKFLDIVLLDIKEGKFCQTNYPDLQYFFSDQLSSIVNYIPYSLNEEVFPVFDKLLYLCQDVMTDPIRKKCIMALIDKYTMKNKAHKASIQSFMKSLMDVSADSQNSQRGQDKARKKKHQEKGSELIDVFDQEGAEGSESQRRSKLNEAKKSTFFTVMLDYCFFDNDDKPAQVASNVLRDPQPSKAQVDDSIIRKDKTLQFRSPHDLHELFVDKLQFFIDALNLMNERHINHFNALIFDPRFKKTLFKLLDKGETGLRLKCHEILEIISTYFCGYCCSKTLYELAVQSNVGGTQSNRRGGRDQHMNLLSTRRSSQQDFEMMEVDFIHQERLYIAQMIAQCVRRSFEHSNGTDSYLQFNSLILLDYLFQNVLPVPTFQNEQLKQRQNLENQVLQQKRFLNQQQRERAQLDSGLNESQMEDGSSGGEGTTGRHAAAQRQGQIRTQAQMEQIARAQRQTSQNYLGELEDAIDLETIQIDSRTEDFEVTDPKYTAMRLKLVYRLWPYVQEALNSPWSNIRSICYGLICSMLKVDVRDCSKFMPYRAIPTEVNQAQDASTLQAEHEKIAKQFEDQDKEFLESNQFYLKLRQFVIPMMINLLSSKESESKAGGLNILGSICGLSYDFSKYKISCNLEFFKRNSEFVSLPIWKHVFELQDDWDITIKEASIVLIQLCAPREAIRYFNKCKVEKENSKFQLMISKMAKNNGQGGHGSMSNLSSARQNSVYNHINSRGSLNGLMNRKNENNQGDVSQRRIDYKNVDFGYKNKSIPNIPGIINEFGKLDIATFLNDNQDMINIGNVEEESNSPNAQEQTGFQIGSQGRQPNGDEKSNSIQEDDREDDSIIQGSKKLALDLGKIYQTKDETNQKNRNNGFDIEAAFQQSSLSQRSNLFNNANKQQLNLNEQILLQSQQQNQTLAQAMQGALPGASQSSQSVLIAQFDFFVDEYSDDQIQEIISIFRNDFKPPKNLWIEKAAESSVFNGPDFYADIYSQAIEQFNQQQLMLQQKQQQELQDQVSQGTQSPSGSPSLSSGSGRQINSSTGAPLSPNIPMAGEFSPTGLIESATDAQKEDDEAQGTNQGSQNMSSANAAQQQIFEDLKSDGKPQRSDKKNMTPTNVEQKAQGQDKPPDKNESLNQEQQKQNALNLELEKNKSAEKDKKEVGQGGPQKSSDQIFDPSLFEQINFDDMNINQEDINQSNQKMDIINSSNSDMGDPMHDNSVDVHSTGQQSQRQQEAAGQAQFQKKESVDQGHIQAALDIADGVLDASADMLDEEQSSPPENSSQQDDQQNNNQYNEQQNILPDGQLIDMQEKYKNMGAIGTELYQIESMSNEVSSGQSNSRQNSQQINMIHDQDSNGSFRQPMVSGSGSKRIQTSNADNIVVLQQDVGEQYYHTPQEFQEQDNQVQDDALESFEKKNSKTLQMIQQDKRNLQSSNTQDSKNIKKSSNKGSDQTTQQSLKLRFVQQTGQSSGSHVSDQLNSNMMMTDGTMPNSAKTQVVDMARYKSDLEKDLQMLNEQQEQIMIQQQQFQEADASQGVISVKPVSNSNSTPEFKSQLQKIASQRQKEARTKIKERNKSMKNKANMEKQNNSNITQGGQNTNSGLDQHNIMQNAGFKAAPQASSGQTSQQNYGNFSHRVQASGVNTSGYNSNGSVNNTKKQFLRGLKQIKTNNEDYIVMQNISNQMGGQLTFNNLTQGLNTTKNKKVDKSMENLMTAFKKGGASKSGHGTSLGTQGKLNLVKQAQSQDNNKIQPKKYQTHRGPSANQPPNQTYRVAGHSRSSGVGKKTLSTSPKRQTNEITKILMGSQIPQSHLDQKMIKSHRAGATSGSAALTDTQPMSSNQQNNPKKIKENMRDLNYFIKTLEKFSKNSKIQVDAPTTQPQIMQGSMQMPPGCTSIVTSIGSGAQATVQSAGSDPQTPKDVLISMGDQMKLLYNTGSGQYQTHQNSNSNTRKSTNVKNSKAKLNYLLNSGGSVGKTSANQKSKSTTYGQPSVNAQQMYEQMKIQQQQSQQVPAATAENIQNQLKKNGFNLSQLNKILQKDANYNKEGQNNPGSRGRSGGRAQGIFDLTPDSNSNGGGGGGPGYQIQQIRNGVSKSSKSNNSNYGGTSYSPPQNRVSQKSGKSQKSQRSGNAGSSGMYNPVVSNLNIKTNMQGMIQSHRDASSVDSNKNSRNNQQSRDRRNNFSGGAPAVVPTTTGRSTSGNANLRKITFGTHDTTAGGALSGLEAIKDKSHKTKKMSFNLNQPPQLNNMMLMNYSQTQKFDLREINQQLFAANKQFHKGAGSTQNKANNNAILLSGKAGTTQNYTMHSQREKRERSAESANSGANVRGSQGHKPNHEGKFMDPPTAKYNNLMLANKYPNTKTQSAQNNRGGSYNGAKKSSLQSPKNGKTKSLIKPSQAQQKAPGSARGRTGPTHNKTGSKGGAVVIPTSGTTTGNKIPAQANKK